MAELNPVLQIEQGDDVAPIGVTADHVYINVGSTSTPSYITLQDWYNAFMSESQFIYQGSSTPASTNVKI